MTERRSLSTKEQAIDKYGIFHLDVGEPEYRALRSLIGSVTIFVTKYKQ